jgi:nitric oxide reductase activation protein
MMDTYHTHQTNDGTVSTREEWNDDTAAIQWAVPYLLSQDAERRIIIHLTDGQPTNANRGIFNNNNIVKGSVDLRRKVYTEFTASVLAAGEFGIDVYGIYINNSSEYLCPITDFYPPGQVSTVSADTPYILAEQVIDLLYR